MRRRPSTRDTDEAVLAQDAQVPRHAGPRTREVRGEVAGAPLAFGEHLDDAPARGIRKRGEGVHRDASNLSRARDHAAR